MLSASFSRMEKWVVCDCFENLPFSTLDWITVPARLHNIAPSLNISKYGCWYFLIIFIVNCGMTCSCCPGQVLTKIFVRASGHHTGQRIELHPSYSSINKTFHFHNKYYLLMCIFPAHWFLLTGYYLSCQPAARVIIDGANPSLSAQLFTYYGPGKMIFSFSGIINFDRHHQLMGF